MHARSPSFLFGSRGSQCTTTNIENLIHAQDAATCDKPKTFQQAQRASTRHGCALRPTANETETGLLNFDMERGPLRVMNPDRPELPSPRSDRASTFPPDHLTLDSSFKVVRAAQFREHRRSLLQSVGDEVRQHWRAVFHQPTRSRRERIPSKENPTANECQMNQWSWPVLRAKERYCEHLKQIRKRGTENIAEFPRGALVECLWDQDHVGESAREEWTFELGFAHRWSAMEEQKEESPEIDFDLIKLAPEEIIVDAKDAAGYSPCHGEDGAREKWKAKVHVFIRNIRHHESRNASH